MSTCRMYEKRPEKEGEKCSLCALRGGWRPCGRSRSRELIRKAEARIASAEAGR